jgi:Transposase DDE domain/Transposase domain (DUF772)
MLYQNNIFTEGHMLHIKDHKTLNMFDPLPFLGPKRRGLMETSWAKLFRDHVLFALPVEKIFKNYHWAMGRPTKELYAMLGVMILQQMHDLTDEETIHQYAFSIEWHYALDITDESDQASYLCPKTLWTMRFLLTQQNLYRVLFESVTDHLAKVFSVDTSKQRCDSVHIFSNMRHLGRIGLFRHAIKKFLINVKRHHKDLFEMLDKGLTDRYLSKQGESVFSMVKPSESIRTLETLGVDLFFLIERFKSHEQIIGMSRYQLMVRLLKEQCSVEQDAETQGQRVSIKPNKEIPSDSLQNPSDPEAGYDGHKGQGYQMQVSETYSQEEETKTLSLITEVIAEPAHKSDTDALVPLIEATQKRGLGPEKALVDSAYGSDENCEKAKALGVEVISPVMGKPQENALTLSDFTLTQEATVSACPQGHAPGKVKHKKHRHIAVFSMATCAHCPHLSDCPVKPGKKGYSLYYDDKTLRLAKRRVHEKTPEFQDDYRFRAGIEGTMSQLDRKTGLKHLRVRGLAAVSFCATLKAVGINILRAVAFRNSGKGENSAQKQGNLGLFDLIYVVKERFSYATSNFVATMKHYLGLDSLSGQIFTKLAD